MIIPAFAIGVIGMSEPFALAVFDRAGRLILKLTHSSGEREWPFRKLPLPADAYRIEITGRAAPVFDFGAAAPPCPCGRPLSVAVDAEATDTDMLLECACGLAVTVPTAALRQWRLLP